MEELLSIYGIGPVKAEELVNDKIIDLQKPIRPQLKKIYNNLSTLTKADLDYHPSRQIPRENIEKIKKQIDKKIKYKHDIAGSFRRKKPMSRDIDLIISHPPFTEQTAKKLIDKLNKNNKVFQIVHVFSQGTDKIGCIISYEKTYYKMDIFAASKSYLFMLLFGTGSGDFNIRMRFIARHKGYLLNQHGLFKDGKEIKVTSEKELFDILNITYLPPEKR